MGSIAAVVAAVAAIGSDVAGLVVLAVAVVVVVVAATWALRRRGRDDVHSVDHYQRTLRTLQGIGTRDPVGEGTRSAPPSPLGAPDARHRRALAVPGRRRDRRRGLLVGIVVVVVGGGVAAGAIEARGHGQGDRTASSAANERQAATTTTTAPATTTTGRAASRHPSTTTTLPARYAPLSSSTTTASYTVPATYSLTLAATTGDCWVQVTGATGTAMLSQTLSTGASQSVALDGAATIVIGAPSVVSVTVDGAPVVLPAVALAPFTVTLSPGAPG